MKIKTLLALFPSIFFCLRYLPLKQAIKLPIIIYKPKFHCLDGKVIINSRKISFGMIRIGLFITNLYPNTGINWYNKGTIVFKGKACIGANSFITVLRENSYLEFGDNFGNSSTLRINCDYRIILQDNVLIGFDVVILDSSLHRLKNSEGKFIGKGYDEVYLGNGTWIASNCIIMQGVKTPDFSVFGAHSLLNKDYAKYHGFSLFAGSPAKFIKEGVWRDPKDNKITID